MTIYLVKNTNKILITIRKQLISLRSKKLCLLDIFFLFTKFVCIKLLKYAFKKDFTLVPKSKTDLFKVSGTFLVVDQMLVNSRKVRGLSNKPLIQFLRTFVSQFVNETFQLFFPRSHYHRYNCNKLILLLSRVGETSLRILFNGLQVYLQYSS